VHKFHNNTVPIGKERIDEPPAFRGKIFVSNFLSSIRNMTFRFTTNKRIMNRDPGTPHSIGGIGDFNVVPLFQ
jgi:hypothetical protein